MIEEPQIFLLIAVLSLFLKNLVSKDRLGPIYPVVLRLRYVGVAVHEIAHYIMSLAVGRIPKNIEIKWRHQGTRNPHGRVEDERSFSFLQAFITALAPLYISTWLIFLSLEVMFNPDLVPVLRISAGFFCISLFLGAAPSSGDFRYTTQAFRRDPAFSTYQVILVCFSGMILWGLLIFTQVTFFLDVFYYLATAVIYLILRFSLIGIRKLFIILSTRDFRKSSRKKTRRFARRHYKPKKPPKLR